MHPLRLPPATHTEPLHPLIECVIFDADATLRRCTVADQACPNRDGEWELIAGVKERLALIQWKERGIRVGIASNQAGVALGYLTEETAHELLWDMFKEAFGFYGRADLIQLCPHPPEVGCNCRKPRPGMIDLIRFEARASKRKTLFVGDLESDRQAAENAGVHFQWAWEFFGKCKEEWVGWLAQRAAEDRARELTKRSQDLGA